MNLVKQLAHCLAPLCLNVAVILGTADHQLFGQTIALDPPPPELLSENGSQGFEDVVFDNADGHYPIPDPGAYEGQGEWDGSDHVQGLAVDHSFWDAFLCRFVVTDRKGLNRVAYRCVPCSWEKGLNRYLCYLQSIDYTTLDRDEQLAYWFNLYNARTVALLVKEQPKFSILQVSQKKFSIKGPFDDKILRINGECVSLSQVENDAVRANWDDPRIHYALNCASIGCPNLQKRAWRAETLDQDLEHAAYTFINSGRAVWFDCFGNLKASKIYEWYQADFGGNERAVLDHVRQYAKPDLRCRLAKKCCIDKFSYNWFINAARFCCRVGKHKGNPGCCDAGTCDSLGCDSCAASY